MRKSLTPHLYWAISLRMVREHCNVLICCLPQNFGTDVDSKLLCWTVRCSNCSVCNCASGWVMQWNTIRLSELLCMNFHAEWYLYGDSRALLISVTISCHTCLFFRSVWQEASVLFNFRSSLVQQCTWSSMNYQAVCELWSHHHCLWCHYFLPLWVPISWFSLQFKLFK